MSIVGNVFLSLNGVDFSANYRSHDWSEGAEDQDDTVGPDDTRSAERGLLTWGGRFTFKQDYSTLDAAVDTARRSATAVTLIWRPAQAAASSTNPSRTGSVVVTGYNPVSNQVGEEIMAEVTFVPAGSLTRAEA